MLVHLKSRQTKYRLKERYITQILSKRFSRGRGLIRKQGESFSTCKQIGFIRILCFKQQTSLASQSFAASYEFFFFFFHSIRWQATILDDQIGKRSNCEARISSVNSIDDEHILYSFKERVNRRARQRHRDRNKEKEKKREGGEEKELLLLLSYPFGKRRIARKTLRVRQHAKLGVQNVS